MNAKVNNWAVELESQNINFEFISGTKNSQINHSSPKILN